MNFVQLSSIKVREAGPTEPILATTDRCRLQCIHYTLYLARDDDFAAVQSSSAGRPTAF
jgi:hypothetical protein